MNYIYDVFLNYNSKYYDFYEWNNNDKYLHVKKIPVVKIDTNILKDLFTKKLAINKLFFKKIYNKYELMNTNIKTNETYCIFSDGKNAIGCCFNKSSILTKTSSMLPDEENEAIQIAQNLPTTKLNYYIFKNYKNQKQEFKTRKTIEQEKFIKNKMKSIINNNQNELLDYIYYEFNTKNKNIKEFIININNNDMNKLYDLLKTISLNNSINT